MNVGAKLLLLQVTVLMLLPHGDPRVDGQRKHSKSKSRNCNLRIAGCEEFKPPVNQGGMEYRCHMNRNSCAFTCRLRCLRGPDGKVMTVSNRYHNREIYRCEKGKWVRRETPRAYCLAQVSVKEVRQNHHHPSHLNKLLNRLLNSSFVYLAMASFYERADVALPGFSKLMTELWESNMKHARAVMTYANTRGGYVNLHTIPRPSSNEDLMRILGQRSGLAGLQIALNETKNLNDLTLRIHSLTTSKDSNDPHMKHFLEDGLISYKVDMIKKLASLQDQLLAFTSDEDYTIGEFSIDLELRE